MGRCQGTLPPWNPCQRSMAPLGTGPLANRQGAGDYLFFLIIAESVFEKGMMLMSYGLISQRISMGHSSILNTLIAANIAVSIEDEQPESYMLFCLLTIRKEFLFFPSKAAFLCCFLFPEKKAGFPRPRRPLCDGLNRPQSVLIPSALDRAVASSRHCL